MNKFTWSSFFGVGLKQNRFFRDFPYYGKITKWKYCPRKNKKGKIGPAWAWALSARFSGFSTSKIKWNYCPQNGSTVPGKTLAAHFGSTVPRKTLISNFYGDFYGDFKGKFGQHFQNKMEILSTEIIYNYMNKNLLELGEVWCRLLHKLLANFAASFVQTQHFVLFTLKLKVVMINI